MADPRRKRVGHARLRDQYMYEVVLVPHAQLINSSASIQSDRQLLSRPMLRLNLSGFQTSVVFSVVTLEKVPTLLLLLIISLHLGKQVQSVGWLSSIVLLSKSQKDLLLDDDCASCQFVTEHTK